MRGKKNQDDFLKQFFAGEGGRKTPRGVDSKFTIVHDRWDRSDYQRIHDEVKDFGFAERQLTKVAGEVATAAMADEFFSLVKAVPKLKNPKSVRPSHQINAAVMAEQMKMTQYESLRAHSVGDPVGTALAAVTMEPHLEVLYDKLEEERKMAEELEQQMAQHERLQEEEKSLEEMIQRAMEEGNEQEAQNFQEQQELIREQQERLRQQIEQGTEEMQESLAGKSSQIRQSLAQALKDANDEAEQQSALSTAWGLDPGTLNRMDATKRIELAKRMKNDKFKRLAELIGPMMRLAWAEQQRKVNYVPEELFNVGIGADLPHMLTTEYLNLNHPVLRMDWMRRYLNHALLQYELRGHEKIAKGGIIACLDSSGSMSGDPEVWSKAVGLALLHVAKSQKRPFTGIHFGSPGEFRRYVFDTTGSQFTATVDYGNTTTELSGPESVIDFAECFLMSGTDFVTPLSQAVDQLQVEYAKHGAVKGDIVFLTDGMCGVPDAWLKEFKETQAKLGFRVFGVVMGGHPDSEPLKTICDGRVVEVKDLASGKDVAHIFRSV